MLTGKFAIQDEAERDIQFLEQPADARETPVDGVLAKGFVHEIRIAACQVGTEYRALAEAEFLDEQRKAHGHLLAGRPSRDVNRLARQPGDPVGGILRHEH